MPTDALTVARLEKLESHVAHLERQCDELNQVIIEQGRLIRKLQSVQKRIAGSIEAAELERIQATQTKPPHYQ